MKLLFVCKHNRFRSKVAEAIFNKQNKNKDIYSESRGFFMDGHRPYISENVIKVMKEKGYSVGGTPKQADLNSINNYDLIVVAANNLDIELLREKFKGKIIKWEIPDCDESEVDRIKEIINMIEEKVKELIKILGKKLLN